MAACHNAPKRSRTALPPATRSTARNPVRITAAAKVVRRFTAWPVAPAAQKTKPTTRKTTPARDVLKNSSAARDGAPQRAHSAAPARWWLTTSHCIRPKDTMEPTTSNAAVWLRLGRRPKFAPPENGYVHAVWASMIETLA